MINRSLKNPPRRLYMDSTLWKPALIRRSCRQTPVSGLISLQPAYTGCVSALSLEGICEPDRFFLEDNIAADMDNKTKHRLDERSNANAHLLLSPGQMDEAILDGWLEMQGLQSDALEASLNL